MITLAGVSMIGMRKIKLNRSWKLMLKLMKLIRMLLPYYQVMSRAMNGFYKFYKKFCMTYIEEP